MFQQEVSLKSKLNRDLIISRLSEITEPSYSGNPKFSFQGEIAENDFSLLPTFEYKPRYLIRPQINGRIISNETYTTLYMKFSLSPLMKRLVIWATIFGSIAIIAYLIQSQNEKPAMWALLLFPPGFLLSLKGFYQLKVNESIRIIKITIQAE